MASIQLANVTLSYPILQSVKPSVKSALHDIGTGGAIHRSGRHSVDVVALSDISLDVADGDRVAIVGHNGAGKTTLLKLIAGIYRPQSGSVRREGRLTTVISPANGMQPNLSGYENIETIGLLSGLTIAEIRERLPDIEDFTELGEFLSLPVSTYSAGMQTRLAFAVATSLNPEILIADENLGAGDSRFFESARERMERMMDRSSILLLASHALPTLQRLCNRAILLEHGRIVCAGSVDEVINAYAAATK